MGLILQTGKGGRKVPQAEQFHEHRPPEETIPVPEETRVVWLPQF